MIMKVSSSAVTMAELIVASIIVTFMMAAIFSVDYGLRKSGSNVSSEALINIQAQYLVNKIRMSVRSLHGSPSNTGVNIYLNNTNSSLCFRHDVQVSGAFTPEIYTDDNWTCFSKPGDLDQTAVYSCELTAVGTCTTGGTFEGYVVKDMFTHANIADPVLVADGATGEYYFQMTVVGRKTPSAGAAVSAGALTAGTTDNPQVSITFRENAGGY